MQSMIPKKPILLKSSRAWRTYLGGKLIDELHGVQNPVDSNFPEEWLLSVVSARNVGRENIVEGLNVMEDGRSFRDLLESDPSGYLGAEHAAQYGATPGVLVKLLDSGERLTVQVHPSKQQAKELFDSEFGKTECWHILSCRTDSCEPACIYLGFREGITREHWKDCFDRQDISAMLECLHKVPVSPGETYLICGGVPHAIGAGCLLVEIQEPTDYTIRTERVTPSGLQVADAMCHQGLGFEKMFDCFDYQGFSLQETLQRWQIQATTLFENESYRQTELVGYQDTPMFCIRSLQVQTQCTVERVKKFSGLYVLEGQGTVAGTALRKGDQFFVPAGCDSFIIQNTGDQPLRILRLYGPQIGNETI